MLFGNMAQYVRGALKAIETKAGDARTCTAEPRDGLCSHFDPDDTPIITDPKPTIPIMANAVSDELPVFV